MQPHSLSRFASARLEDDHDVTSPRTTAPPLHFRAAQVRAAEAAA